MLELKEKKEEQEVNALNVQNFEGVAFRSNIWKSYVFHFFMGGHFIAGVLLVFFMTWGKLSFVEVMFLQSYFTIMVFAFEVPCGAIADYISRKFSLFLGGLSIATAALVYSIIPNLGLFILGETLWAFGEALISGTDSALIYDTLKKMGRENDVAKISARNGSFFLMGIGFAGPLGSLFTLIMPVQFVVTVMFLPFFAASIIALTFNEPNHDLIKDSEKSENYLTILKSGVKELKDNKILRILAFDLVLVDSLVFFIIWTYQLYLKDLGIQVVFFGFVAASLTVMQIVFTNLIPKIDENISNKKRFLVFYTIIPGVGFILISMLNIIALGITLVVTIVGIGFSRNVIYINGINRNIEGNNRATILSTINMIGSCMRAILYPLVGYLVMFNLDTVFLIIGITIIVLALVSRVKNEYL